MHVEVPSVDRRRAKLKLLFSLATRGYGRILDRVRGSQRLVRPGPAERANLSVAVCGDCCHGLSLSGHQEVWRHGGLRDQLAIVDASLLIDQGFELARRLPLILLLHATLSLLHWTLVKRRAINALTLVDGAQFGLDGCLLGGLGALLV